MASPGKEKLCFLMCPIGAQDSPTRKRSDQILKHIVRPIVKEKHGYEVIRADQMPDPGTITTQILDKIINADIIIADLTEHNPNVFYELAIAHAFRKQVINMIEYGEVIPFDVHGMRTIEVDHHDLDSVEACKERLSDAVQACQSADSVPVSPLSAALDFAAFRQSGDPNVAIQTQIFDRLERLSSEVANLRRNNNRLLRAYGAGNPAVRSDSQRLPTTLQWLNLMNSINDDQTLRRRDDEIRQYLEERNIPTEDSEESTP